MVILNRQSAAKRDPFLIDSQQPVAVVSAALVIDVLMRSLRHLLLLVMRHSCRKRPR
jgi:hypothetical protein